MTSRAAVILLVLAAAAPARAELTPVGPELQVNSYTTGFQTNPDVAMDSERALRRHLAERVLLRPLLSGWLR